MCPSGDWTKVQSLGAEGACGLKHGRDGDNWSHDPSRLTRKHCPADPLPFVRILAPSGSAFGTALTAALGVLGWAAPDVARGGVRALTVILVETDDGLPVLLPSADSGSSIAACLGSVRSLDALVPLVRRGAVPLDRAAHQAALEHRRRGMSALASLTRSERRVLAMLGGGLTTHRIARSDLTVRSQIRSVLEKLQVDSQLVAVALARRAAGRWPDEAALLPTRCWRACAP